MWVTIVGRALEKESKGMNETESLWHLPRVTVQLKVTAASCARRCVNIHDATREQCRKEAMSNKLTMLFKQAILRTSITAMHYLSC